MSMPSDTQADVAEAAEAMTRPAYEAIHERLTPEQIGLIAAAAVAFIGVAFLGPAWARANRPKPLSRRAADQARDARHRARRKAAEAREAGRKVGKRVKKEARRLGGGGLWR